MPVLLGLRVESSGVDRPRPESNWSAAHKSMGSGGYELVERAVVLLLKPVAKEKVIFLKIIYYFLLSDAS